MAKTHGRNGIKALGTHPAAYVTPTELARYWGLKVAELLDHIRAGRLPALRFSQRLFRVRTADAIEFEGGMYFGHISNIGKSKRSTR
jgi:hypothetical protein